MKSNDEHLSVRYRRKALPLSFVRRVLRGQQQRIYERFLAVAGPDPDTTILDLGVNGSLERPEQHFFEYNYPHPSRIVAAGLEEPELFQSCFPEIPYLQVARGETLPFADGSFDIVFCNAVIEHVGDREAQRAFLEEILRVGRRAFVTTPNRWYPVDLHTVTPLLHWLPARIYRPLYRLLGFEFFSREENLNLLDRRSLLGMVPPSARAEIHGHRFLGLTSNLLLWCQEADEGPLQSWVARKSQPIILLHVLLVFLGFVLLAHFVVHSSEAVKALVLAAIGFMVPLVPMVMARLEYRMTEEGLEKRPLREGKVEDFRTVVAWDELSHIVLMARGFKFYKPPGNVGGLVGFWRTHLSDEYSGECQVEIQDRNRVLEALTRKGISGAESSRPLQLLKR